MLSPIVRVLEASAGVVLTLFGIREVVAGASVRSAEELRAIVDEAEGSGVIPRAQEELLHNVFDFVRREARDVMVPAPDVAWLDADATADGALDFIEGRPHSRYPVGEGSLDRLVGVVHVRDIVAVVRRDPHALVRDRAHPAPIVPETKDLGALLRELRERRQHLAVVVDEYGGTAGIVTLEDIVEELVGEIEDEYDLPDDTLTRLDDHTVSVAGSMTIDDFNEAVGTSLPQDHARTMAGLVFSALGRRPVPGDAVVVDGARLEVDEVAGLRITRLRVRLERAQPHGEGDQQRAREDQVDADDQPDRPGGRAGQLLGDQDAQHEVQHTGDGGHARTGHAEFSQAHDEAGDADRHEPDHEHDREGERAVQRRDEQVQPGSEREQSEERVQDPAAGMPHREGIRE
jgi:putative hemolysin